MNDIPMKIIPLGGLGEIGKNMMVVEYNSQILIIDAGIAFPSEINSNSGFGVADTKYLSDKKNMIKGILITHGHDDHIGGLSYFLSQFQVPVYSTPLTKNFIEFKIGNKNKDNLHIVDFYESYKLGEFQFQFFPVCHSIPDSAGILVKTATASLVHTGDFKFDDNPTIGNPINTEYLSSLSSNKNLILCSDSTYAEKPGHTDSESVLATNLEEIIRNAQGRVLVATFSSLLSRVQQIINISTKLERKVAVVGRSMIRNLNFALDSGYVRDPKNTVISLKESSNLHDNQIVLITTGAQGEINSAMGLISNMRHSELKIQKGDTVVISSSPIPGNEVRYSHMINNIFRQGGEVIYQSISLVHVHGHGSQNDLKRMITLVRPKYFIPIHGETRHLVAHAKIAENSGVEAQNIFLIEDGYTVEITKDKAILGPRVASGTTYINH
ncbi:MAG: ribonuclease J [Chloroflexi bacterium]|nr:ribonuclease J [Chloroflexota bacterium]